MDQVATIIRERNNIIHNKLDVTGPELADAAEWVKINIKGEQDALGPRVLWTMLILVPL